MFTPAISCLTTSNLPWFRDLTFQVPMQYCSLHHQTLLLSPVTSTDGYFFCFGSIPSFFLELFLHWSPVAYWAPTDLGSFPFSILSFCLFILFMGFSRQEYWSGLPFPSPVDHILSDLSLMTHPSLVAPRVWLSFIEIDKSVVLVWLDWLAFCDYDFSVSALLQHLPSYSGFSYLGCVVSLHGCSSKAQPLLLNLDEGYLLTTAPPDLERGIAPLGPPAPLQPLIFRGGVAPPSLHPWPRTWGSSSRPCSVCCRCGPCFPTGEANETLFNLKKERKFWYVAKWMNPVAKLIQLCKV